MRYPDLSPSIRYAAVAGGTIVTALALGISAKAESLMPTSKVKAGVTGLSDVLGSMYDQHIPGTYRKTVDLGGTSAYMYGYSSPTKGKNGKVTYTQYTEFIYPGERMPLVSTIIYGADRRRYSNTEHFGSLKALADDGSVVAALSVSKYGVLDHVSVPKKRDQYYKKFMSEGRRILLQAIEATL